VLDGGVREISEGEIHASVGAPDNVIANAGYGFPIERLYFGHRETPGPVEKISIIITNKNQVS
jgi:hypothetical protein